MADAGTAADLLTRTIKKVLDEETVRLENGLSVLANAHRSRTDGPALQLQSPATAFIELQGHSTLADAPVRPVPSTGHARDLFRGSLGKA